MLSALFVLASFNLIPVQAQAQAQAQASPSMTMHCVSRAELLSHIKPTGGQPLFVGLAPGVAMEVWHQGDLWAAFMTRPDGIACIFAQGNGMGFADPDSPPSSPPTKD